jgi:hypothetical protein
MEHKHPIDKIARDRLRADDFAISKQEFKRIQRGYLIADLKAFAVVVAVIVAVVAALN